MAGFLRRVMTAYGEAYHKYPMATAFVTAVSLGGGGDIVAQKVRRVRLVAASCEPRSRCPQLPVRRTVSWRRPGRVARSDL